MEEVEQAFVDDLSARLQKMEDERSERHQRLIDAGWTPPSWLQNSEQK